MALTRPIINLSKNLTLSSNIVFTYQLIHPTNIPFHYLAIITRPAGQRASTCSRRNKVCYRRSADQFTPRIRTCEHSRSAKFEVHAARIPAVVTGNGRHATVFFNRDIAMSDNAMPKSEATCSLDNHRKLKVNDRIGTNPPRK